MFSFLKKEKKKKSPVPDYDAKLIKKFHKDHKKLVMHIENINKAFQANNIVKAKQSLQKLKMEMLGHFMEEDIKLYWYMKHYYKDSEHTISTIKIFEESIKKIQKDVVAFLDYYSQETIALDKTFEKEFNSIIDALSTRIATEESNLYTLYIK